MKTTIRAWADKLEKGSNDVKTKRQVTAFLLEVGDQFLRAEKMLGERIEADAPGATAVKVKAADHSASWEKRDAHDWHWAAVMPLDWERLGKAEPKFKTLQNLSPPVKKAPGDVPPAIKLTAEQAGRVIDL